MLLLLLRLQGVLAVVLLGCVMLQAPTPYHAQHGDSQWPSRASQAPAPVFECSKGMSLQNDCEVALALIKWRVTAMMTGL